MVAPRTPVNNYLTQGSASDRAKPNHVAVCEYCKTPSNAAGKHCQCGATYFTTHQPVDRGDTLGPVARRFLADGYGTHGNLIELKTHEEKREDFNKQVRTYADYYAALEYRDPPSKPSFPWRKLALVAVFCLIGYIFLHH